VKKVEAVFYVDARGREPVLAWIKRLKRKVQNKCLAKIIRLEEEGHSLSRPDAAYLRDDIYELRIASDRNQYRILYFFHGGKAVVLCHAFLKKKQQVPKKEIDKAVKLKKMHEERARS